MTQETRIFCDQCKIERGVQGDTLRRDAWLQLENTDMPSSMTDQVRLSAKKHFCGFSCLLNWAGEANPAAQKLVEAGKVVQPRGTFTDKELGLQY